MLAFLMEWEIQCSWFESGRTQDIVPHAGFVDGLMPMCTAKFFDVFHENIPRVPACDRQALLEGIKGAFSRCV